MKKLLSNEPDERKRGATLDKIFKPFFKKALGGDYIIGWDYSSPTTIVK